ncbi:MAG TPA: ABC transporter permease subunit, partial [Ilumatobacteraceae bacterium]|nr:ABC transporter permease subunit [Ilumatobacteraceae bacterium]
MTATIPLTVTDTTAGPELIRWRKRRAPRFGFWFGTLWLTALTFCAVFADYLPFIRSYDAQIKVNGKTGRYNLGPGWTAWMGTDASAHDVFARCIYGARMTLLISVSATIFGLVFGGLLGVCAGYFQGKTDRAISIFTDCLLALPALLLALLLVYRLDELQDVYSWLGWLDRKWSITFTLGILFTAPLARIVRAQTIAFREREFVIAARSLGARSGRVVWREIVPNLIPAMLTVA